MNDLETVPLIPASEPSVSHPAPVDPEAALLESARTMDQDALIQVFDRYAAPLYRYALRLCSDAGVADQIVGDVFARLLEQLSVGRGPQSNLRSYLYQVTYHLVVDEMRYSKRRAPLEALENVGYEDSSFATLEDQITFEKVMDVVRSSLTADQQHVIILRFIEGMSLTETAAIMGKQVNHVKVLQTRAIQRLRKSLQAEQTSAVKADAFASRVGTLGFDFAG